MKAAVIWGAVLALLLGGAYFAGRYNIANSSPDSSTETGYVGFQPRNLELGDHLWDTVLPLELTFVNDGPAGVVIESITSTCDCVVFEAETYEGQSVESGSVLAVPLTLHTGLYPGVKRRMVKLVAASGSEYTAELFVNVHGTWSLEPDTLDFGDVLLGDPTTGEAEQTLTFVSEVDELVGEPQANAPWLCCFAAQRDANTTEILVRVLKAQLPPGVSTANIVFETTSVVRPDTAVYVRAKGVPALVATPADIVLVGSSAKRARFTDRRGAAARIARVDSSSESIQATIVAEDEVEFAKTAVEGVADAVAVHVEDVEGRRTVVFVSAF